METYRQPIVNNRPLTPSDLGIYADIRFDADDSAPIYIGLNLFSSASTSGTDWKLYKFTYSGANVTRVQMAYGSWEGRVGAF